MLATPYDGKDGAGMSGVGSEGGRLAEGAGGLVVDR